MEFDYKGYKLQIYISRSVTPVEKNYYLKGECGQIGYEFFSSMDDGAFERLAKDFKEHVNYVDLQIKKLSLAFYKECGNTSSLIPTT